MKKQHHVQVGDIKFGNDQPLSIIAGPCSIESREHAMEMAHALTEISKEKGIGLIFKSSYDKANRTSMSTKRGIGMDKGLEILAEIKSKYGCPILTDIHTPEQCEIVGQVVDVLQIPAFLCRQTDLLIAAGKTGKALNVKKGQFLAPWDMKNVVEKIATTGNHNIMTCDRGTCFGYNTLVSDMRGLPIMGALGYPVIFDATHSVQQPGGQGGSSGGQREFAPVLARAAVATGIAGVFMETHDDPDNALSDGPNMIRLSDIPEVIDTLMAIDKVAKAYPVKLTA